MEEKKKTPTSTIDTDKAKEDKKKKPEKDKKMDFLNINLVELEQMSDKELETLHKEGHYYWQLHEAGKLKEASDVEFVINSHVAVVQEMTKRELKHGLGSNLDFVSEKLFPGYSKSEADLLFGHERIHQSYKEEPKEELIALHMDSEVAITKSGYMHIEHNDKLDQKYEEMIKAIDDIGSIKVPASTFNYWVISEFLDCKIKDVFSNSVFVSSPQMGSFLKSFKENMTDFNVLDTRNFTHDGRESPPGSKVIKLNSKIEEDFLVSGMRFLENKLGQRYVAQFNSIYGGLNFTLISRSVFKELNKSLIKTMFEWMKINNYLKNEKFTINGEFLTPSKDLVWEDIKLDKSLKDNLIKINELINGDKEKKFSRGLLFLGPPGTGKTLTCKLLMKNAASTFIWVTAKDLGYGASEVVSEGFRLARDLAPTILCFEDIDTYLNRGCVDVFKTELDGLVANEGVTTILTTNYPEQLPLALLDRPGRFHDICNFALPSPQIRLEMVQHLNKGEELETETIEEVIRETEDFSGAHIHELVAFAHRIKKEKECPLDEAFLESLTKLKNQKELVRTIKEGNKGVI